MSFHQSPILTQQLTFLNDTMPQSHQKRQPLDISTLLYDKPLGLNQPSLANGVSTTPRGPPPSNPIFRRPPFQAIQASPTRKTFRSGFKPLQTTPGQVFPSQASPTSHAAGPANQFSRDRVLNQDNQAPLDFGFPAQPPITPPFPSIPSTGPSNQGFATNPSNVAVDQPSPWPGMQPSNLAQTTGKYYDTLRIDETGFLAKSEMNQGVQSLGTAIQFPQFNYVQNTPSLQADSDSVRQQYAPCQTKFPPSIQADARSIQQQYPQVRFQSIAPPSLDHSSPSGLVSIKSLLPLGRQLQHLHAVREQHRAESDRIFSTLWNARLQQRQQAMDYCDLDRERALELKMQKMANEARSKDEELGGEIEKLKKEVGRIEAFLEEVMRGCSLLGEGDV